MRPLSESIVHQALERVSDGLERYLWLQSNVLRRDVSKDRDFQKRFDGFYRVRRRAEWRAEFFALMENSKSSGIPFAKALRSLALSTGQIEASFASKLIATLDPSKPVIDKFVLSNFELRLPYWGGADREERTLEVYEQLRLRYAAFLTSPDTKDVRWKISSR